MRGRGGAWTVFDDVPRGGAIRDRIEKLEELRRPQNGVGNSASFDQPFLDALCTQVSAVADAIRANHR